MMAALEGGPEKKTRTENEYQTLRCDLAYALGVLESLGHPLPESFYARAGFPGSPESVSYRFRFEYCP